jgi:TatA/E family protein of Tat protein translocase
MPGFPELAIILLIVLLLFGPGKLPQVFKSLGEGLRSFREASTAGDSAVDVTRGSDQISEQDVQDIEVVKEASAFREPD